MITLDLHLHTNFSDGSLPLPKLVDLYGSAGIDAIAVTDHLCTRTHLLGKSARFLKITLTEENWDDYIKAIEKERNRAWREYKMHVFTGVEYTHNTFNHKRNAHILAVDIQDFVSPALKEEDWITEVKKLGALTIAAHPLKLRDASSQTYYLLENAEKFAPLIDLWEAGNAKTLWRKMLKTPFSLIASSDLHSPSRWPCWRTQIDCEKDPSAIKEYLKRPDNDRDFVFITGRKDEVKHRVLLRNGQNPKFIKKGVQDDSHVVSPLDNVGWLPSYA
jgi:predicted metal-dependent phosphoesterase TrpH